MLGCLSRPRLRHGGEISVANSLAPPCYIGFTPPGRSAAVQWGDRLATQPPDDIGGPCQDALALPPPAAPDRAPRRLPGPATKRPARAAVAPRRPRPAGQHAPARAALPGLRPGQQAPGLGLPGRHVA